MFFSYIFLHNSTFQEDLPTGLLLCIVPFLLGWLFAYIYHKVGFLRTENTELTAKVNSLTSENTEVRLKLTQAEAEIESKKDQLHKAKDDLMMCESERNALREQVANKGGGGASGGGTAAFITFAGKKFKANDLKIVEGIGPKIAELLQNAGIKTWKALSETAPAKIKDILEAAGSQFNIHDPGSWPEQARLADKGDWNALKSLQDKLDGGKA